MAHPHRIAFVLLTALLACAGGTAAAGEFSDAQRRYRRVRAAFTEHGDAVRAAFRTAKAAWPPRGLYLRAFKHEGVLEVWAASASAPTRTLVRSIPICASSGGLGPKVVEGDGQVPEGFYRIDRFNPMSSYHLSLGLNYPNAVDRARGRPAKRSPGGDIFVHGSCVTIGCLPLEDGPIAWLYVVAVRARDRGQRDMPVHIFPCRFGTDACRQARAAAGDEHVGLWESLEVAQRAFDEHAVVPVVRVRRTGYVVIPAPR